MRVLLAILASFVVALSVEAAPRGPTTAEAETFGRLYVEAVNSEGGFEAYLKRNAEQAPEGAIRAFFEDQRWVSGGGVDLVGARVRQDRPDVIELAVRNRLYGALQGVELTVAGEPDLRVTYSDLTPAPLWAVAPQKASTSRAELARRIGALVEKGCQAERFSGAVLVAAGEAVLVEQACGEASRRYHAPNNVSTRFNIGSMDKMFTAVAVARLAEAERLSLDDTLDRHLDATWIDPMVASRVTLWQLMTHTSGLSPDIVDLAEALPRTRFRTLQDYKPLLRETRVATSPGSKFQYSNTGMVLLGAVIERISGEDYYEHIRKEVFTPSGMSDSGSYVAEDPIENVAVGYMRAPDAPYGWRENSLRIFYRGIPAGGGYSTVEDLHRFATALQSGKLVSEASLQRLWTDKSGHNYGAGFEIGHGAVGRTIGHSGLFAGVSTRLRIYPDRGYSVIVLANIDRAAPALVDAIEGELLSAPNAADR